MPSWLKVLLIVALIMVLIIYLMGSCVAGIGEAVKGVADGTLTSTGTDVTTADAKGDYIPRGGNYQRRQHNCRI